MTTPTPDTPPSATPDMPSSLTPALARTLERERQFGDAAAALGAQSQRVSLLRLVSFLAAVVGVASAAQGGGPGAAAL
ncbi:MAG: hypothetical protein KC593_15240, partial [Myxococcales bacterium]|nr:hypothetical protein [Myxococcales bacterium]